MFGVQGKGCPRGFHSDTTSILNNCTRITSRKIRPQLLPSIEAGTLEVTSGITMIAEVVEHLLAHIRLIQAHVARGLGES